MEKTVPISMTNSYLHLGDSFYQKILPEEVSNPQLLLWNHSLADELGIGCEMQEDTKALARYFSGDDIIGGTVPIALAYAGHQFGHFVPQLGDGRAHLLGEVVDREGQRRDIQLKGSGKTKFSRGGDGRCGFAPAVREFIMSEAMYALGIPTSRSLAVVTTGNPVVRERVIPGAIVTRVASSHIRFGTFQYFAAREDLDSLKKLADYTLFHHYPEIQGEDRYLKLLDKVQQRQIRLVVEWMRVGFIHGVMNTDNIALSGETIDYGPCAMMGEYNPATVYSSIDTMGRYAFGNQPEIARWNLARFAECLLPLISEKNDSAIKAIEPVLDDFSRQFQTQYEKMMAGKFGFINKAQEDNSIIGDILTVMKDNHLDFTVTFDQLTKSVVSAAVASQLQVLLGASFKNWHKRVKSAGQSDSEIEADMRKYNPVVIPRNHHVEEVLKECEEQKSGDAAENFLEVLRTPYKELHSTAEFQDTPHDGDRNYRTFCGT